MGVLFLNCPSPTLPFSLLPRPNHTKFNILFILVFRTFNTKNDNRLCEEQFVKGMSIYLNGSLQELTDCKNSYTIRPLHVM